MSKNITYDNICSIGMELFRKNNDTFMRSKLSIIMERIFLAANKYDNISNKEAFFMRSGKLPDRVYYIYSDEMLEKASEKMYDIVNFKGERCIWFYSDNVINLIGKDPARYIDELYDVLNELFIRKCPSHPGFHNEEQRILTYSMNIVLAKFINETYRGSLDLEEYKKGLCDRMHYYTKESVLSFIDDVYKKCNSDTFFSSREYLDSYMLLEEEHRIVVPETMAK